MSYTPCPLCREPLQAYAGSPCTNPSCRNRGANPDGKPLPPELMSDAGRRAIAGQRRDRKTRSMRRAFKGL